MGWRTILVSKPAKLDLKLNYMVCRDSESTVRVHISEISVLIIETTAASITTALLNELTKQKIKIIFCDEKRNPSSELVPYFNSCDSSSKIRSQINWTNDSKGLIWTYIVREKIRNQARVLEKFNEQKALKLYEYIDEIEFYDESNREGHAAKVYFNALFGMDFSRNKECAENAALDYGYSILLSCINREIVCCGYLTQIGIFHCNKFNHFNLGSDLMEPFRPIIDMLVKRGNLEKFESEQKKYILNVLNYEFVIDGRRETLLNTMKLYVKSVFDALESCNPDLIKFFDYEL